MLSKQTIKKLTKIVNHLRKSQSEMLHEKFDFSTINCDSAGCALGEFPAIFPKSFVEMDGNDCPRPIKPPNTEDRTIWYSEYLGIDEELLHYLFYPQIHKSAQIYRSCKFNNLDNNATKEQVADHIEQYIKSNL